MQNPFERICVQHIGIDHNEIGGGLPAGVCVNDRVHQISAWELCAAWVNALDQVNIGRRGVYRRWIADGIVGGVSFSSAGNARGIRNAIRRGKRHINRESDGRITGAGSESIVTSASQCAEHAAPA